LTPCDTECYVGNTGGKTPHRNRRMTFREDVSKASKLSISSAGWIHACNVLIILAAVLGIPFTMFGSLFALLAVPFDSALAAIATNSARQTELTKIHLMLLADQHNLN